MFHWDHLSRVRRPTTGRVRSLLRISRGAGLFLRGLIKRAAQEQSRAPPQHKIELLFKTSGLIPEKAIKVNGLKIIGTGSTVVSANRVGARV
jgi:hypothetical protein